MFRFYEGKNKKKSVCLGRNGNKFNTKIRKAREKCSVYKTHKKIPTQTGRDFSDTYILIGVRLICIQPERP